MEFAQLTPGSGFEPVRSLLYYSQRIVTRAWARRLVVRVLRKAIRTTQGAFGNDQPLTEEERTSLALLSSDGYTPLSKLLKADQIADIKSFMEDKLLEDRVKAGRKFTFSNVPEDTVAADYNIADIVNCPHILQLVNNPSLLRLAANYLGCKPTISALGLRWSFPGQGVAASLQSFHRDSDDWRFVKVFVYLSEVNDESGPHVYVRGTQQKGLRLRLRPYSDAGVQESPEGGGIIRVTGPAGFAFMADTSGIHKGQLPRKRNRLMLQFQYSLLPTYAYRYRPVGYDGPLQIDPYINRLIVGKSD